MSAIYSILLTIDGAIYDLISSMFTIFNFLAKTDLFSNDLYGQIVRRMYVILGMIMMFALAYSLLKAVINPDEFSKGENSFPKLIKNVVISLGIIAVLPTVFTVAFNIQNSILNYDTIPKLVLGEDYNSQVYQEPGRSIAFNTYSAFLHVNEDKCEAKSSSDTILTEEQIKNCGDNIAANTGNRHWYNLWLFPDASSQSFTEVVNSVNSSNISFANFNQFSDAVTKGEISYIPVVSTICGLFLLYVLVNFCFDMAVRVVKLMFFQIIAPIPVVCRVIPGGKMKDVFSTWTKKTISTFIDVFIRIFIMYIGVFVIKAVIDNWDNIMLESNLTSGLGLIAKALIIMGVIIFIRQAPKLLADMFHLDAGDMKLGIMDKLAAGGALTAGALVGGGATALTRNAVNKIGKTKWRDANGNLRLGNVAKGIGSVALSSLAGGASGALRSGKAGLKAKNFGDMKKSASDGAKAAVEKRYNREKYWASHSRGNGLIDDVGSVLLGHASDAVGTAVSWAGYKNLEQLKLENAGMDEITNSKDAMENAIKAYIEKEVNKGNKDVGIATAYDSTGKVIKRNVDLINYIAAKDALARAQSIGQGVVAAQAAFGKIEKQVMQQMANALLVSSDNWSNYSDDDRAHLGDLRVGAVKFKGAVYNNSNLDALKEVGIVGDNFTQDKDVEYGVEGSPLENMGDSIKRHKSDNNVEIATRSQEGSDNNKKS